MNPARDLAHAFAGYWRKAFDILENPSDPMMLEYFEQGGSMEELQTYAKHIVGFILSARDSKEVPDLKTAIERSGYEYQSIRVRTVAARAISAVLFGAYFAAYRECESGDEYPFDRHDLAALRGIADRQHGRVRGAIRKALVWLLGKI